MLPVSAPSVSTQLTFNIRENKWSDGYGICWSIFNGLSEAKAIINYDTVEDISYDRLNAVVIGLPQPTASLVVPHTRFGETVRIIVVFKKSQTITVGDLLMLIHEFYNKVELTQSDLDEAKEHMFDDVWDEVNTDFQNGYALFRKDIMGSRDFYEGFHVYGNMVYLRLGS